MKDVLNLAAFGGKVLCLIVFVAALRPNGIGVAQTSMKPTYFKIARSGMAECGLNVFAAASEADVRPCNAHPRVSQC